MRKLNVRAGSRDGADRIDDMVLVGRVAITGVGEGEIGVDGETQSRVVVAGKSDAGFGDVAIVGHVDVFAYSGAEGATEIASTRGCL